jgi:hypothetical protein
MGPDISDPGRNVFYPTLIGETNDPTIGGTAPRLYFTSFSQKDPGPQGTELKSVVLRLSPQ